jgi:hypothetical protein
MKLINLLCSQSKTLNQKNASKKTSARPNVRIIANALSKVLGPKTKCSHCGKFMFIRTWPKNNARVVVTKAEADKIEEEWSIFSGTHDIFVAEKQEFAKEKEILRKKIRQQRAVR